ncbi:MAG: HDOD domain-containing protein, partial [Planctomycetia bacterium]|nr:HDOD domain-containing protein [Planctomycetia bacterium]
AVELLAEQDPPVLVIHTGVMEPKLARDLMARGVDDILFKPVDGDVLAVKVMALIDRRRSRAAAKTIDSAAETLSQGQLSERGTPMPGVASAGDVQQQTTPPISQNVTPVSLIELRTKSAQVKQVLPISQTAMDVFEMANAGSHDAAQIADAIATDASLVVEVLRLANSSLYNRSSKKITGLEDAVALLGQKRVGEMAVATNALGALTAGALPWMDVPLAWRRSVAAGMAIESIIAQGGHRRIECGLMIGGIMHNLGRVVLGTLFPTKYESMVESCKQQKLTLLEVEESVFPTNHAEFLAHLLSQWNVPADIRHPLKFLLEPYSSLAAIPESTRTKARLIKVAVAISQVVVGRWEAWDAIELPADDLLTSLGITDVPAIIERTRAGLEEVLAASPKDAPKTATSPTKARHLAYINLAGAPFDFVREVVSSTDTQLVETSVGAEELEAGVLVNCLGVPPREFAARLPIRPQGQVLIVTDSTAAQQYSQFGQVLRLPQSYDALRSACWEASRTDADEQTKKDRCNVLA